MHLYSDSKVADFLGSFVDEQRVEFLNGWNETRNHREKIYLSYDSTNKNCQAGDIEMVEYGKAKVDSGLPIINYSLVYDTKNRELLFYEAYPRSITDVSKLQFMIDKAKGYGYKKIGFILDRGYFSKRNIEYMDERDRYFHIYHSNWKKSGEKEIIESKIEQMTKYLIKFSNAVKEFGPAYEKYFELYYDEEKEKFMFPVEKTGVIEHEIDLCGWQM